MDLRMNSHKGIATIAASLCLVAMISAAFVIFNSGIPNQDKNSSSCIATISIRSIDTGYPGAVHYKEGKVRVGIPYEFGVQVTENQKYSGSWGLQFLIVKECGKISSGDIVLKYYKSGTWKDYPYVLENGHWKGFVQYSNKMTPCQKELIQFVLFYNNPGSYTMLVDAVKK